MTENAFYTLESLQEELQGGVERGRNYGGHYTATIERLKEWKSQIKEPAL